MARAQRLHHRRRGKRNPCGCGLVARDHPVEVRDENLRPAHETSWAPGAYPIMTHTIRDNQERGRFELDVGGQIVFAMYGLAGDKLVIPHVEAPPALRGTGAAGRLMGGIMELARAKRLKIIPLCSYAASWLRRRRGCSRAGQFQKLAACNPCHSVPPCRAMSLGRLLPTREA